MSARALEPLETSVRELEPLVKREALELLMKWEAQERGTSQQQGTQGLSELQRKQGMVGTAEETGIGKTGDAKTGEARLTELEAQQESQDLGILLEMQGRSARGQEY